MSANTRHASSKAITNQIVSLFPFMPLLTAALLSSVPILYQIALQSVLYMDFNLLVLTSFEVTTMDS